MIDYRQYAVANHVAYPPRSQTQGSYASNEHDNRRALVPRRVSQSQVMLVRARAVQNLAHQAQDVDRRDNNRGTSNDRPHTVERVIQLGMHR